MNRELMEVWQRYYMSKKKDSYGLESTTQIPFYYFVKLKERIIAKSTQTLHLNS